ncbi:hypothetical protein JQN58_19705 [Aneurinibacillus sp. BA2021]|nr:hypothetical protein [Aneurinibacillus sp. BA2021]
MDNKKGVLLFCSIFILSSSIVLSSTYISEAINNVGLNLSAPGSTPSSKGNYELLVKDGWLYLYEINSGQIWKKADNDDPNSKWQAVKHFTE